MAEVIWRTQATEDLRQIIRYINHLDPVAAQNTGARLLDLGDSLADFPRRGRQAGGERREMTNVPPYILGYVVDSETVFIESIRHGARNPD